MAGQEDVCCALCTAMAVSKLTLLLFCSTLCDCSLGGSSTEESQIPRSDTWMHPKCLGRDGHSGMGFQKSRTLRSSW